MLGFDDYADISARLGGILDGDAHVPHTPRDRRTLLPLAPVDEPCRRSRRHSRPPRGPTCRRAGARVRAAAAADAPRRRPDGRRSSWPRGCDRRCTFCAIPTFRGSFVSRRPHEVIAEARWLADQGVRELVLVSENSTSYGKDLGDLRLLETLLPELAALDGVERVRVQLPAAGRDAARR